MAFSSPNRTNANADVTLTGTAATVNGPDKDGSYGCGVLVYINISTLTGTTPTLTVTLQGKDPVSGNYYNILASAALSATGLTVLRVYPGLLAAANSMANDVIPTTFRVITAGGGTITAVAATITTQVIS